MNAPAKNIFTIRISINVVLPSTHKYKSLTYIKKKIMEEVSGNCR